MADVDVNRADQFDRSDFAARPLRQLQGRVTQQPAQSLPAATLAPSETAAATPPSPAAAPAGGPSTSDAEITAAAETLHMELNAAGLDSVLDDRGLRPGAMFADIELIGIPHRVVISARGLASGTFEYRARSAAEPETLGRDALFEKLRA